MNLKAKTIQTHICGSNSLQVPAATDQISIYTTREGGKGGEEISLKCQPVVASHLAASFLGQIPEGLGAASSGWSMVDLWNWQPTREFCVTIY